MITNEIPWNTLLKNVYNFERPFYFKKTII